MVMIEIVNPNDGLVLILLAMILEILIKPSKPINAKPTALTNRNV